MEEFLVIFFSTFCDAILSMDAGLVQAMRNEFHVTKNLTVLLSDLDSCYVPRVLIGNWKKSGENWIEMREKSEEMREILE